MIFGVKIKLEFLSYLDDLVQKSPQALTEVEGKSQRAGTCRGYQSLKKETVAKQRKGFLANLGNPEKNPNVCSRFFF